MEPVKFVVPKEEIARVKGLGFLQDKLTVDCFNGRVITRNGKITAQEAKIIAEASEKFGSGDIAMTSRLAIEIQRVPFDNIEPLLKQNNIEKPKNTIVFVLFQHRNDNTIAMCKKFCNSNKNNFEQAVIYNPVDVQMDFYKPVPKFYKLYDHFCENLYFDLAFIDDKRE